MAECFNTTVPVLEEEIMQLILDGQVKARIDSHNKVSKASCHSVIGGGGKEGGRNSFSVTGH